ncbi:MAG: DUF1697 domain-containing protein [Sterolibacterium sp.]|jgi:uncharacterized protein (DUF1697 family)
MKTYVILLRGVTPTGRNRVPMAELRVALAEAGLADVRTYIQSGNVIAGSNLALARVGPLVHHAIKQRIGADLAVIARTPQQFASVLKRNPFPLVDSSRLYFSLLASPPSPEALRGLLDTDFGADRVTVVGDTLYTLYATKLSDSRFTNNYFERKLKVAATTRNFNTVSRLVELSAGGSS